MALNDQQNDLKNTINPFNPEYNKSNKKYNNEIPLNNNDPYILNSQLNDQIKNISNEKQINNSLYKENKQIISQKVSSKKHDRSENSEEFYLNNRASPTYPSNYIGNSSEYTKYEKNLKRNPLLQTGEINKYSSSRS